MQCWSVSGVVLVSLGVLAPPVSSSAAFAPQADTGVSAGIGAAGVQSVGRLTGEQVRRDLLLLERALETLHPGYERYTPRAALDANLARLRASMGSGATVEAMYLGVSDHLARIRCDHTKAEYPDSIRVHRESNPTHLPMTAIVRGGRMFVGACEPGSGLVVGDEILEIDNEPVVSLLGRIRGLVSIDGYTEHSRDDEIELTSEYMGSALEQYLPLLHGWSDARDVLVRRGDEFLRPRVACVAWEKFLALAPEAGYQDFIDSIRVTYPGEGVAALWVGTFVNYRRPIDPDEAYGPIFAALAERGVEHLIVDLRNNGGGSTDAAVGLARRLIRTPVTSGPGSFVRATRTPEDLRVFLSTWDESAFEPPQEMFEPAGSLYRIREVTVTVGPADDAFAGRVTLLTSRGNASGVTNLLATLAGQPHITTVGEPTGGSAVGPTAGTIVFLRLPESGITVRVPLVWGKNDCPGAVEGLGVTPDVVVKIEPEDVLAGRDPVLEEAMRR
ncbi:MAG: S41 family peptidase [Phycisphaerales bacterium]